MKKRELKEITLASAVQNGGEIRYAGRLTREEEKNIILYMIQQNKQGD